MANTLQSGLIIAFLAATSACSSMNKDECSFADWQAVGYEHGAKGESATVFKEYQEDCAKHAVKADFAAFKRGHQIGLEDYCTYEQGKSLGEAGEAFNNLCPSRSYPKFDEGYNYGLTQYCSYDNGFALGKQGQTENAICGRGEFPGFSEGYTAGYARYELVQSAQALEDEMNRIVKRMEFTRQRIIQAKSIVANTNSNATARSQAAEEIRYYQVEQYELERAYYIAERNLARLNKQLRTRP